MKNPGHPFDSDLAGKWLMRTEKKAQLPKLAGGRWHPYRRILATELAHVPAKTAAMLGGCWRPPNISHMWPSKNAHLAL